MSFICCRMIGTNLMVFKWMSRRRWCWSWRMMWMSKRFLARGPLVTTVPRAHLMEVPLVNPPQCRLCGQMGHRTNQCPDLSEEDPSFVLEGYTDAQKEEEARLSEERERARKQPPQNMEVEPRRRARGPEARAAALQGTPKAAAEPAPKRPARLQRGLPPSEDEAPELEIVESSNIQGLTAEEMKMVCRLRAKKQVSAQQRAAHQALTGWEARYPSLSNVYSDDLACNVMKTTVSRFRTYLWKKLLWQMRVKMAVQIESKGRATWKRNPRWLSLLLSYEVASLWGHFGAMRQRLRSADFLAQGHGREWTPSGASCRSSSRLWTRPRSDMWPSRRCSIWRSTEVDYDCTLPRRLAHHGAGRHHLRPGLEESRDTEGGTQVHPHHEAGLGDYESSLRPLVSASAHQSQLGQGDGGSTSGHSAVALLQRGVGWAGQAWPSGTDGESLSVGGFDHGLHDGKATPSSSKSSAVCLWPEGCG